MPILFQFARTVYRYPICSFCVTSYYHLVMQGMINQKNFVKALSWKRSNYVLIKNASAALRYFDEETKEKIDFNAKDEKKSKLHLRSKSSFTILNGFANGILICGHGSGLLQAIK